MSGVEIIPFQAAYSAAWDEFCGSANNATFLHSRRFLEYHGTRFSDASVLLMNSGRVVGLFPAAIAPRDAGMIVSHPGITYGGILHDGRLHGATMVGVVSDLCAYYRNAGFHTLQYKVVPHIYAKLPSQDDIYALFRAGANLVRCDLSCSVDLGQRQATTARRRRGLKKAQMAVTLTFDPTLLAALWGVIDNNLARKYRATPVHSLEELLALLARFPEQIQICCALMDGRVEAGIVLFNSPNVWHAQYIAASEIGYDVSALDAVFDAAIGAARQSGASYFDFGTSNEDNGKVLNDGLYRYKHEFGGGGVVHEYFEIHLIDGRNAL